MDLDFVMVEQPIMEKAVHWLVDQNNALISI